MDHRGYVALGIFAGAQLLVVLFSVLIANAYRERSLMYHAAAGVLGLLALFMLHDPVEAYGEGLVPATLMLLVVAVSGGGLNELVKHVGGLRLRRAWLVRGCAALPFVALGAFLLHINVLPAALAGIALMLCLLLPRAWPQSQPWMWWVVIACATLISALIRLVIYSPSEIPDPPLVFAALMTVWSASTYLAMVWRSRLFGETNARMQARNLVDPLTGLHTPLILVDRIEAARGLVRRYGHPSAVLLVQIENLGKLTEDYGPEIAESAVLAAAIRIRQSLGPADVAARMSHARIAVLAEGAALGHAAAQVGTRILVSGLKEPLPPTTTAFLQFRMVMAAVPSEEMPVRGFLRRMGAVLEQQMIAPGERRIVPLTAEDLARAPVNEPDAPAQLEAQTTV